MHIKFKNKIQINIAIDINKMFWYDKNIQSTKKCILENYEENDV